MAKVVLASNPDPKLTVKWDPNRDPKEIVLDPQHCFLPCIKPMRDRYKKGKREISGPGFVYKFSLIGETSWFDLF